MIGNDIIKNLASCDKDGILNLHITEPGLILAVSHVDGIAGKLLQYLYEKYPEESITNMGNALLIAHWWIAFMVSMSQAEDEKHE